eukprot:235199-Chlamydomonas_euryale.AAC.4
MAIQWAAMNCPLLAAMQAVGETAPAHSQSKSTCMVACACTHANHACTFARVFVMRHWPVAAGCGRLLPVFFSQPVMPHDGHDPSPYWGRRPVCERHLPSRRGDAS